MNTELGETRSGNSIHMGTVRLSALVVGDDMAPNGPVPVPVAAAPSGDYSQAGPDTFMPTMDAPSDVSISHANNAADVLAAAPSAGAVDDFDGSVAGSGVVTLTIAPPIDVAPNFADDVPQDPMPPVPVDICLGAGMALNGPVPVLAAAPSGEATSDGSKAGSEAGSGMVALTVDAPNTVAGDRTCHAKQNKSVYHVAFHLFCDVMTSGAHNVLTSGAHNVLTSGAHNVLTSGSSWKLGPAYFFLMASAWLQIHLLVVILQSISWHLGPSVSDIASSLYSMSGAPPAPPPSQFGDYFYASNKQSVVISRLLVFLYIAVVAQEELSVDNISTVYVQRPINAVHRVAYLGALLCPIIQSSVAVFAVYVTYAYLNKFNTVGEVVLNGVGISFVLGIDDVLGGKLEQYVAGPGLSSSRRRREKLTEPLNMSEVRRRAFLRSSTLKLVLNCIRLGYHTVCLYCLCNIADWKYNSRTIAVFVLALYVYMFAMVSNHYAKPMMLQDGGDAK